MRTVRYAKDTEGRGHAQGEEEEVGATRGHLALGNGDQILLV